MESSTADTLLKVRDIFTAHLESNNYRKTPERFAILEEIDTRDDHFDAETLYIDMKSRDYHVSRATVYNTLELLVASNLVASHQFGKNLTQYEKSYGCKQHDHLICENCHKVMEFCDPRVQQIKAAVGKMLAFEVTDHSLNLYGLCDDCREEKKGGPSD